MPGIDADLGAGPDDVDGDVTDPGNGASGNFILGLLTGGIVGPLASPGGTISSAVRNAPSTVVMDVGPAANKHGTTEDDVDGTNLCLSEATVTPA